MTYDYLIADEDAIAVVTTAWTLATNVKTQMKLLHVIRYLRNREVYKRWVQWKRSRNRLIRKA